MGRFYATRVIVLLISIAIFNTVSVYASNSTTDPSSSSPPVTTSGTSTPVQTNITSTIPPATSAGNATSSPTAQPSSKDTETNGSTTSPAATPSTSSATSTTEIPNTSTATSPTETPSTSSAASPTETPSTSSATSPTETPSTSSAAQSVSSVFSDQTPSSTGSSPTPVSTSPPANSSPAASATTSSSVVSTSNASATSTGSTNSTSRQADLPTTVANSTVTSSPETSSEATSATPTSNSTSGPTSSGVSFDQSTPPPTTVPSTAAPATSVPTTAYPSRSAYTDIARYTLPLDIRTGGFITTTCNATEVSNLLNHEFGSTTGFIEVLGPPAGTNYQIEYRAKVINLQPKNNITREITLALQSLNESRCFTLDLNRLNTSIEKFASLTADFCSASYICDPGYKCEITTQPVCVHMCQGYDCSDHGTCDLLITTDKGEAKTTCRCDETTYTIYSGDKCENSRLNPEIVVAIVAGVLGGFSFILLVVIYCMCCRKRERRGKKYNLGGQCNESYESSSLHMKNI